MSEEFGSTPVQSGLVDWVQPRIERDGAGWLKGRGFASKLSEIILGGQDGLVNVAGVILGLAAATNDTRIIIAGGLAATFAESISMAAVAYTSAVADRDYYEAEMARERREVTQTPERKRRQLIDIFTHWGITGKLLDDVIEHITRDEEHWIEIMVAHDLQLQPIASDGLVWDAVLVGFSAVIGSLVPLWPFFFFDTGTSVWLGLLSTALVLFIVGAVKARLTVGKPGKSGLEMLIIGMVAALVGYGIGALFGT